MEEADRYFAAFVERGAFRLTVRGEEHRLSRSDLLVARPGQAYRCTHEEREPTDSCLVLTLEAPEEEKCAVRWRQPVTRASSAVAYLFEAASRSTSLGLEAGLFVLAQQLFEAGPGVAAARLRAAAPRLDLARQIMEAELAEPLTISQIAARAALSPWHFSRLFREFTGESPHRFLRRLRLLAAARFLRDGMSVTDACYAAGFSHPSHFARSFRRASGVLPSSYCRMKSTARKC